MAKSFTLSAFLFLGLVANAEDGQTFDAFHAMLAERAATQAAELEASPFSRLRNDFFSRYTLDPEATPSEHEVGIDATWNILLSSEALETATLMAGHLSEFFDSAMELSLPAQRPRDLFGRPVLAQFLFDVAAQAWIALQLTRFTESLRRS